MQRILETKVPQRDISLTREVDVPKPGTRACQGMYRAIRDAPGMPQMQIVKMLSQQTYALHGTVCQLGAFGQDEISDFRRNSDDAFNALVTYRGAAGEIQHSEMLELT